MSKTYKKLVIVKHSVDYREATKVVEVPLVDPSDDQILLKILYSGIHAGAINISAGRYASDGKLPFDAGIEGIGVIESVGKNVTTYKVGDVGMVLLKPAYAEYLYIKTEDFIPIPSADPEFIALLDGGLTASMGLDRCAHLKKDDKVLITAAAGGVGHIAVQLAKLKDCHVIGTCSSSDKVELLKQLGCDRVINYKEQSIDDVLTREYPNGIDVVWETIGGSVFETLVKHLAIEGRLVIIGAISGYKTVGLNTEAKMPQPGEILRKSLSISGFALFSPAVLAYVKQYVNQLIELVLTNQLRVVLDFGENSPNGVFKGIDSVVRGVEYLHTGRNIGKVVVQF